MYFDENEDIENYFNKYPVKEGQEEAFHSDYYAFNFYDLKLSGPD